MVYVYFGGTAVCIFLLAMYRYFFIIITVVSWLCIVVVVFKHSVVTSNCRFLLLPLRALAALFVHRVNKKRLDNVFGVKYVQSMRIARH